MQSVSDWWKNQQRDRVQNKNCAERDGHFFFIGLQNRADGGDRAPAANRRASGNQKGRIAAHSQKFAERQPHEKRERNPQRGVDETAAPRFQNFVQIHSEAQRHNGTLQKSTRNAAAFVDIGMREAEAKENSSGERDWRRKQSRERKCERESKNNFRKSGHRPGKEYQAGYREGQRVRLFARFLRRRRGRGLSGWRGSGLCWGGLRRSWMREGGNDFCGGGFADLAVTVVDAALSEREGAAAVAGFGVEFVKRGNFLLRR